jgi:hypothetical protein
MAECQPLQANIQNSLHSGKKVSSMEKPFHGIPMMLDESRPIPYKRAKANPDFSCPATCNQLEFPRNGCVVHHQPLES